MTPDPDPTPHDAAVPASPRAGKPAAATAPAIAADAPAVGDDGWQPLPPRARPVFIAGGGLAWLFPALGLQIPIGFVLPWESATVPLAVVVLVALPLFGMALAARRFRYTGWRLDRDGFAVRRGSIWQSETRVPVNRVQHVDLKRGPLERRFRLATLVVHTAGTRHSAVAISGLDDDDAVHLRDHLARQLDDDDDDA